MIKANDIRCGNWLTYALRPIKVVSVSERHIGYDYGRSSAPASLQPIELSPELLVKIKECEKYGTLYRLRLDGNGRLISLIKDGDTYMVNLIRQYSDKASDWFVPDMECKYLHQLQNLYYALTGTELSITL